MDKYMDIKELSQYLTIKQATLYAWAAQEKIPRVKIHGLLRFRRDEIDQWVEGFRKQAPRDSGGRSSNTGHVSSNRIT